MRGGCNFRWAFCHKCSLVVPERLAHDRDVEQVLAFLKKRQGTLDGVAVTGGEPLLHKDIDVFLQKVHELGYMIKLDTNGSFPDRLIDIVERGLVDRVAMDIKNAPELYAETVGVPVLDLAPVERSKNYLLEGHVDYEFRTTVVRGLHTAESIAGAAKWIAGAKEYYLQQFKDSGDVLKLDGLGAYGEKEMHTLASSAAEYVPAVQVRGI